MQNIARQANQKLFRYTASTAARSCPSVKQSEFLKNNPVPGICSWYETERSAKNELYTARLHLQHVDSGRATEILLDPNFPQIIPNGFEGTSTVRDVARKWKSSC